MKVITNCLVDVHDLKLVALVGQFVRVVFWLYEQLKLLLEVERVLGLGLFIRELLIRKLKEEL